MVKTLGTSSRYGYIMVSFAVFRMQLAQGLCILNLNFVSIERK